MAATNAPAPSRPTPPKGSVAYILGMIGAVTYYVSVAHGSGQIIVGLLKALVWPAYFVYDVLKFVSS